MIWRLFRLVLGLTCTLLTSCQNVGRPALYIYTWADYLSPEVIAAFEKNYRCRVHIDTFDSNEAMYAKLKAGGRDGYDVVFPTSYMAELMQEQNWLLPLKSIQLPNLTHLNADFLRISPDPDCRYSAPYMITLTGVGYLSNRIQPPEKSWSIFHQKQLKSRMTLLNDMRETIGAALLFCGFDPNTTDPAALKLAQSTLLDWRRNIAKFENEQYKMGLACAEFLVCHAYLGDITKTQRENSQVNFYLPQEGFIATCDDIVVLQATKNPSLAHAFVNHLLSPEMAAKNATFTQFLTSNSSSLEKLDPATADLHRRYLSPKVLQKAHLLRDLKAQNAAYISVWDRVKSGVE